MDDNIKKYFIDNNITIPDVYTLDDTIGSFLWRVRAYGYAISLSSFRDKLYLYAPDLIGETTNNERVILKWNERMIKM